MRRSTSQEKWLKSHAPHWQQQHRQIVAHLALLLEDAKWMTLEARCQKARALTRKQSLLEDSSRTDRVMMSMERAPHVLKSATCELSSSLVPDQMRWSWMTRQPRTFKMKRDAGCRVCVVDSSNFDQISHRVNHGQCNECVFLVADLQSSQKKGCHVRAAWRSAHGAVEDLTSHLARHLTP